MDKSSNNFGSITEKAHIALNRMFLEMWMLKTPLVRTWKEIKSMVEKHKLLKWAGSFKYTNKQAIAKQCRVSANTKSLSRFGLLF